MPCLIARQSGERSDFLKLFVNHRAMNAERSYKNWRVTLCGS